jgi:hypothetical protein
MRIHHVQLDGVKRSMDVIRAANEQMHKLRSEFEGMHELCRKVKGLPTHTQAPTHAPSLLGPHAS